MSRASCCAKHRRRHASCLMFFGILLALSPSFSQAWVSTPSTSRSVSVTRGSPQAVSGIIPLAHGWGARKSLALRSSLSKNVFSSSSPSSNTPSTALYAYSFQNTSIAETWLAEPTVLQQKKDQATLLQHKQGVCVTQDGTKDDDDDSCDAIYPHQLQVSALVSSSTDTTTADAAATQVDDKAITWARLLIIGAAALYGTNFSLVKLMGESDLPVGMSLTIRFGMATLATSPWLWAPSKNEKDAADVWPAVQAGLEVGLWNSVGYVAQAVGLETTAASVSAFLCSLAVVVVPFLDVWSGKRLKGRQWAGALLALAGVGLLELGHGFQGTWTSGDVASMLQPLAFGVGFWRLEQAMHRYPAQGKRGTAAQILAVFLSCVVYTITTESISWDQVSSYLSDPATLALFFWTGVISTALSVYMESVAFMTLTAAESTLLLSTEPLWGALWAALLVNEQLGTDTLAGGLMILIGCLYSSLGWNKLKSLAAGKLTTQQQQQRVDK